MRKWHKNLNDHLNTRGRPGPPVPLARLSLIAHPPEPYRTHARLCKSGPLESFEGPLTCLKVLEKC